MAILRVKDELGEWMSIPAIKGEKGDKGDKGEATEAIKDDIIDGDHTWSSSKIDTTKLDKTGNASSTTVDFTESAGRESINTGESSSTLFGKIKKWFSDLKVVAFTGSYNDLVDTPESLPANGGNADTVDNKHASDFMIKYNVGAVSTFDTFIVAGVYRIQEISEEANVPIGMSQYGQLLVLNGDNSDTITQIYCTFDTNAIFSRSCHSWGKDPSNWTEWEKISNAFQTYDLSPTNADEAPTGISAIHPDGTNNPFNFYGTLMTFNHNDIYKQQIALPWGAGESRTIKYRVKDNGVWYEWKNLNDGGIALFLFQEDKRSENNTPEWYWTNYPMRIVNEFKSGTVIGLPQDVFVSVETRIPWSDSTGGYPMQIARRHEFEYSRYGTSATTWSDWVESVKTLSNGAIYAKRESGQSANEGGQITLEVGTTSTLSGAVNVDAHANAFRIFESGGLYRGAYIDIATCSQGVTDRILTSKNVSTSPLAPSSPLAGDVWIW